MKNFIICEKRCRAPTFVEPEAERLGESIIIARHRAEQHAPMMTLWKCAIRNRMVWSWKLVGGTAISTPVMPPITKVTMKPMDHRTGY